MRMSRLHGQVDDMTVANASFGDNVIGKMLHVEPRPLSTVTSMQLSWSKWTCNVACAMIVMIVKIARKALRQFALVMVVDVN